MDDLDFPTRMKRMPDEDIIRIAKFGEEDGYELLAIKAALDELENRKLPDNSAKTIEQQVSEELQYNINRPVMPLENKYWILFFLFGFVFNIIAIIAVIGLFSRGYKKKAIDAIWAVVWGFGFVCGSLSLAFIIGDIFFS